MYLVLDFETASEAEIRDVGLYNYATHPSTRALMLSYGFVETLFDKIEVKRWEPRNGPMPSELLQAIQNPDITIIAFNSAFERYIFKYVLGIDIPVSRFQDPQASARYLSLPASLDDVGNVLGLPHELRKDPRGRELIELFSMPHSRKKKELKENPLLSALYFNDSNSHVNEWKIFGEYCDQDVRAELEIARREHMLGAFPLPPRERAIWLFDQKVNDRGMPVDRTFVQNAFKLAERNKQEKLDEQNRLTGLENANSAAQLLPWAKKRGYPINDLRKQNIELILKSKNDGQSEGSVVGISDECRRVLEARMEAGSTSYKKLEAIVRNVSGDGWLRGQFIYMGSARCGRWSGNAVQLHNMARPDGTFEDMDNVNKARNFIYQMLYEQLKKEFKKQKPRPMEDEYYSPLIIIKNLIRTVFVAPAGKRFNVCDLNAIETRVAAWVAECGSLLQVFADGLDPYLAFAVKMTGIPYEKLLYDLKKNPDKIAKAAAKLRRQIAKPGVLGAVYRLSAGGWGYNKNGDQIKTGLWGYAEAMGVEMSQAQAQEVVKIFRESYPEICGNGYDGSMKGIWVRLEEAVIDVLQGERTVRFIGPNNSIKIDKLTIKDRNPILRIQLPSGRHLHYLDASVQETKMPWRRKNYETGQEEDVYRDAFTYYGMDQDTKQWTLIVSHGGKIFENIVQATARDVLADKLLEFESIGLETVGHVHDEGICLSDDDPFAPGVMQMEQIMNRPVTWAPTLPLGSDGFEDMFYHK
jgi:DNA polymerase bacteriophage-type